MTNFLHTLILLGACFSTNTMYAQQSAYSVKIDGGNAGDHFGYTLAVCSDAFMSADGLPDLIVGAPDHDWGGSNSGRLTWFSLDGSMALEVDRLDGDGWDELLCNYSSTGRVLSGYSPHSVIQNFGSTEDALFFVGDFDGDGISDVSVFHSYNWDDHLAVYSGANLSTVLLSLAGTKYYSRMGSRQARLAILTAIAFRIWSFSRQ